MDTLEWSEFKLDDLFQKIKVKSLKYRVSQLPNKPKEGYTLPALTAGIINQGLNCYVPKDEATVLKNVISISANGANTGATFYQNKEFTVLQDAYAIEFKYQGIVPNDDQYLFLTGAVSKAIYGNYEWTNKAGWERIRKDTIHLPINKNGKIDFEFMGKVIRDLKNQCINKVEVYLKTAGLNNYHLSKEEQCCLNNFEKIAWKEFKVVDLFNVKNTANILLRDIKPDSGITPYLTAKSSNNSISSYIAYDSKYLEEGNSIFIGGKTFVVTYQKRDYFSNDSHNLALYFKERKQRNEVNQLFFITTIKKSMAPFYSWGDSISYKKIQKDTIFLPINDEGKVDFIFIETFIKAIQKKVIKNVVDWNNSN